MSVVRLRAAEGQVLIAAEAGWRSFSGPDLSETQRFQRRRLRIRSDEIVFDNACVRAPGPGTADQEIGAGRRTGRRHPRAAGSAEWLEARDLAELGAMTMVFGALQIQGRAAIQRGAAELSGGWISGTLGNDCTSR